MHICDRPAAYSRSGASPICRPATAPDVRPTGAVGKTSAGHARRIAFHRTDAYAGMDSATVRLSAATGGFGPFHRAVVVRPELSLVALRELRLLADGTTVMLYEYNGPPEVAEEVAREHLTEAGAEWHAACIDGQEMMFAHTEPSALLEGILEHLDHHPVVVDWPIRFATDGTAIVTLIGQSGVIREAMSMGIDEIDVRIDRFGEYTPDVTGRAPDLTDRELRALRTAVELGHYENPRGATYADLAAELGCSTGTVGHHLRNAEAKVMQHMFG